MKIYIKISIGILAFCVLSNFFIFRTLFSAFTDEGYYRYSNYNGSCTIEEPVLKGAGLGRPKVIHQDCLIAYPNQSDKKLYRLFWKNPFLFWRWRSYFVDERYQLPYKNWKEIEELRRKDRSNMKCYQEF